MKYLITGNAGTGKSTVIEKLHELGHYAYDTDNLPKVTRYLDKETGELVDKPGVEGFGRYASQWQEEPLEQLLNSAGTVFVGGSVSNGSRFYHLFDTVFGLLVDDEALTHRLQSRTNNDTGKNKRDLDFLVGINQRVTNNLTADPHVITIDATHPLEQVVADILGNTDEHRNLA